MKATTKANREKKSVRIKDGETVRAEKTGNRNKINSAQLVIPSRKTHHGIAAAAFM